MRRGRQGCLELLEDPHVCHLLAASGLSAAQHHLAARQGSCCKSSLDGGHARGVRATSAVATETACSDCADTGALMAASAE